MPDASLAAFAPPFPAGREPHDPAAPRGRNTGGRLGAEWRLPPWLWIARLEERRQLARLALDYPCYLLRDVGLRREDLMREAAKPFWRP